MPKGKTQESGSPSVTQRVTDEELQSALEEALALEGEEETPPEVEAAPEEQPKEEPQPVEEAAPAQPVSPPPAEEPTDPRERTALGRKVKGLELEIQRLNQLLSTKPAPQATPSQGNEEEAPEFITTPDELERYLAIRERKRQAEIQGYQTGYGQRFLEIGADDPLYAEVEQEMMTNFNRRETGNPRIDAELNYHRSRASVLSKKLTNPPAATPAAPKIPGKGDKPQGSGVTIASRNARPASAPPPLDEYAAEFIRRTGMKEDSVREALGNPKPRR